MRFLLLCPAALLLLTGPAKTVPTESAHVQVIPSRYHTTTVPTGSAHIQVIPARPPPKNFATTGSARSKPIDPKDGFLSLRRRERESLGKKVSKLRRELEQAQAELKALNKEDKILGDAVREVQKRKSKLKVFQGDLSSQLHTVRRKLREAQDRLSTGPPVENCNPTSPLQVFNEINEETDRQLEELKAKIQLQYAKKYNNLLYDLRLKIRTLFHLVSYGPMFRI